MRTTSKGQITLPAALRRRHNIGLKAEVEILDDKKGILIRAAGQKKPGQHIIDQMLAGGKIPGNTAAILKLTRGDA